jgi:hypothetical protein
LRRLPEKVATASIFLSPTTRPGPMITGLVLILVVHRHWLGALASGVAGATRKTPEQGEWRSQTSASSRLPNIPGRSPRRGRAAPSRAAPASSAGPTVTCSGNTSPTSAAGSSAYPSACDGPLGRAAWPMPNAYTRQASGRNRHLMSTKPGTSFSPRREHLWLSREVFSRRCTPASPPIPSIQRTH